MKRIQWRLIFIFTVTLTFMAETASSFRLLHACDRCFRSVHPSIQTRERRKQRDTKSQKVNGGARIKNRIVIK